MICAVARSGRAMRVVRDLMCTVVRRGGATEPCREALGVLSGGRVLQVEAGGDVICKRHWR